jgi:hypothetical protein
MRLTSKPDPIADRELTLGSANRLRLPVVVPGALVAVEAVVVAHLGDIEVQLSGKPVGDQPDLWFGMPVRENL